MNRHLTDLRIIADYIKTISRSIYDLDGTKPFSVDALIVLPYPAPAAFIAAMR